MQKFYILPIYLQLFTCSTVRVLKIKLLVIAAVMEDMILKIDGSGMLVATNVEKLDILFQCVVLEWSVQKCDWR